MKLSNREARFALFLARLAALETETEINERTDDAGMSGDDACETLSGLITEARALLKAGA